MKICWDNLEKLRFNKKTGKWYVDNDKGYIISTYHYREKCLTCNEPFLSAKNREIYCCKSCGKIGKERTITDEWRKNLSKSCSGERNGFFGKLHTEEAKEKMRQLHLGKSHSDETKEKLSILFSGKNNPMYGIRRFGENSTNWKGGKSSVNQLIRSMKEYGLWRDCVFKRDNYTCCKCGNNWRSIKGLRLNAHHIIPISENYSLSFVVENGITLCEECHIKEHKNVYRYYIRTC